MDNYTLPSGYAETMDKLKDPSRWDIPGVIADVAEDLRRHSDNGAALAVIDTLSFRMKDIAERITHGHAKKIDADTIREAGDIASMFVSETD